MSGKSTEEFLFISSPDPSWPSHVQALWHDGQGDWETAHTLINHLQDQESARVHAYLHRKEGDHWNADYWYRRSGVSRFEDSLEAEWALLVREFYR